MHLLQRILILFVICLIGIKDFIQIQRILVADTHAKNVVYSSTTNDSNEGPNPFHKVIYRDIDIEEEEFESENKEKNNQYSYFHLLEIAPLYTGSRFFSKTLTNKLPKYILHCSFKVDC